MKDSPYYISHYFIMLASYHCLSDCFVPGADFEDTREVLKLMVHDATNNSDVNDKNLLQ